MGGFVEVFVGGVGGVGDDEVGVGGGGSVECSCRFFLEIEVGEIGLEKIGVVGGECVGLEE